MIRKIVTRPSSKILIRFEICAEKGRRTRRKARIQEEFESKLIEKMVGMAEWWRVERASWRKNLKGEDKFLIDIPS